MKNSYEICEALKEYYVVLNNSDICTEILLNTLKELYLLSGDYLFKKEFDKIINVKKICPECYAKLKSKTHYEKRDSGYEMFTEYKCPQCGISSY